MTEWGKKGDLSSFERGMVVGARRVSLSISQSAQDFHTQPFLGFTKNGEKKGKNIQSNAAVLWAKMPC